MVNVKILLCNIFYSNIMIVSFCDIVLPKKSDQDGKSMWETEGESTTQVEPDQNQDRNLTQNKTGILQLSSSGHFSA